MQKFAKAKFRLSLVANYSPFLTEKTMPLEIFGTEFLGKIDKLKKLSAKCRSSRERYADYEFLEALHSAYRKFDCEGHLDAQSFLLAGKLDLHWNSKTPALKILLEATTSIDEKLRSRWLRALQYAEVQRHDWYPRKSLTDFLLENGGIAGSARKIAKPRQFVYPSELRRDWR
jgi:hypothetical protein